MDRDVPSGGRIAIKFGPTSGSHAAKKPSRPSPPSTLGKRQRPHALKGDSESEGEGRDSNRHEVITSFGPNGASKSERAKHHGRQSQPLVVQRLPNRDWRSQMKESSRGRLPHETDSRQNGQTREVEPADKDKNVKWGLSVKNSHNDDEEGKNSGSTSRARRMNGTDADSEEVKQEETVLDADQEALDALLGKSTESERRKDSVIPSGPGKVTEDDAYQRDVRETGEVSTLEDYESMPVEEFGAALLRGLGWDGKPRGKIREVKRRPNLIGLGAKELKVAEELGAGNQKDGRSRPPRLHDYNREEEKRRQRRRDRER